jgi:hypothetical protein
MSQAQTELSKKSLQLGVFGLGLLQDGNVGVGIFPKREEILIRRLGFGSVALQHVAVGEAEMGYRCRVRRSLSLCSRLE